MTRLIQVVNGGGERRVASVEGDRCLLIEGYTSVFDMAMAAIEKGVELADLVAKSMSDVALDYDAVHAGGSEWRLLPAVDHPEEAGRCLVTGTGLTHKASVDNRQAMHEEAGGEKTEVTDSMRMYQWGLEGGKPAPGVIGTAPEWFYKGNGTVLKGHGEPLDVPPFAEDGGEEPEIAGAYIIDADGNPRRVGLVMGNEFADHVTEKKNYLYLAPSKLRQCSLGPELILDADFADVQGEVRIERGAEVLWSRPIATGEENMSHSLANMEHHHFKFPEHRRPGDVHVHFFGADGFSFGDGVKLEDGDVMVVAWEGYGKELRNPVRVSREDDRLIEVRQL